MTEVIGTIAFASSGAMLAIQKEMDLFGVCVLGVVTAVGGGMTRDIILGKVPGALTDPAYVAAAVVTSLVVFVVLYFRKGLYRDLSGGRSGILYDKAMLFMDSIGLGIFTVMGVMTGIEEGYLGDTFLLTVLGTLTGVGAACCGM